MSSERSVKKIVHLLLGVLTILVIITGLGIAYYQTIEYVTLGILSKTLSFKVHTYLFVPFLLVLLLHSFMPWILRNYRSN
jgi:hypothetical protein